jgi:hypothetical protein
MKLEDQLVSLELAKRLKELGVKQDGVFHWVAETHHTGINQHLNGWSLKTNHGVGRHSMAAFTVAELGVMLPQGCASFRKSATVKYRCVPPREMQKLPMQDGETEADARAKMLIYLLENKLLGTTHSVSD